MSFPTLGPESGLSITVTTPTRSVPEAMLTISPTSIFEVSETLNTLSLGEAGAAFVRLVTKRFRVLGVKEGFTGPEAVPFQVIPQV